MSICGGRYRPSNQTNRDGGYSRNEIRPLLAAGHGQHDLRDTINRNTRGDRYVRVCYYK